MKLDKFKSGLTTEKIRSMNWVPGSAGDYASAIYAFCPGLTEWIICFTIIISISDLEDI